MRSGGRERLPLNSSLRTRVPTRPIRFLVALLRDRDVHYARRRDPRETRPLLERHARGRVAFEAIAVLEWWVRRFEVAIEA